MSLLEILVVLAIMGLVIAIAAPPMVRTLEALRFKTKADNIAGDISLMRVRAVLDKTRFGFPQSGPDGEPVYDGLSEPLPAGWKIDGGPLVFLETGVCFGSEIIIVGASGRSARYIFSTPDCAVEDASV